MKIKNNNTKIVKTITREFLKKNKIRNIFLIFAIALTSFMIFTVAIVFFSFYKNASIMWTRVAGGDVNIALQNPTDEQIDNIIEIDGIAEAGLSVAIGEITNENLSENHTTIAMRYYDRDYFTEIYTPAISDVVGEYPRNANEIMISRPSLAYLGEENLSPGDSITLQYKMRDDIYINTFYISGIFTDYSYFGDSTVVLISEEFMRKNGFTKEDGIFYMQVDLQNQARVQKNLEENILLKEKQRFQYSFDSESNQNLVVSIFLVFLLSSFFIFSGFLLIYNIMYISVIGDIRFYGLLKTIGTSPTQTPKIVSHQVYLLSVIGIPIGMLFASFLSYFILPLILNSLYNNQLNTAMPKEIYFNPIIFIFTIVFVLFTIQLSCRKPSKIASKISPIEAVKYTGISVKNNQKVRKSIQGGKLYKMAWYNIFREKKRSVIVFISLFIGITTFLSIATFINALDLDNYLTTYYPYDLDLLDSGAIYGTNNGSNADASGEMNDSISDNTNNSESNSTSGIREDSLKEDSAMETLVYEIMKWDEIKDFETKKLGILEIENREEILLPGFLSDLGETGRLEYEELKAKGNSVKTRFVGISEGLAELVYKETEYGFDLEAFLNGEIVLVTNWGYRYGSMEDAKIQEPLRIKNEMTGDYFECEIVVISPENYSSYISVSEVTPHVPGFAMSEKLLTSLTEETSYYEVYLNVAEEYKGTVIADIVNYADENNLQYNQKSDGENSIKEGKLMMWVLNIFVSTILILTGLLNFINVIVSSLNSRKIELALLECVGMTKRQIEKMITLEGLYYGLVTSGLILTLGLGIIYGVGVMTEMIADYAIFKFPMLQMVVILLTIYLICIVIPKIVYKRLAKGNVVDRIRNVE